MTSPHPDPSAPEEAMIIALSALCWTLEEPTRSDRLLALTGLDPNDLRAGAGNPATLAAILAFLEGHEPDLVACAQALGHAPTALVRARHLLEGHVQ